MRRRDFVTLPAALWGGEILAQSFAIAETSPVRPVRTGRLVDDSNVSGEIGCQSSIFDGQKFICLYRDGFESIRGMKGTTPTLSVGFSRNSRFAVAATAPDGNLLWNYPLPSGNYISLGTLEGAPVIFNLRYSPESWSSYFAAGFAA